MPQSRPEEPRQERNMINGHVIWGPSMGDLFRIAVSRAFRRASVEPVLKSQRGGVNATNYSKNGESNISDSLAS